MCEGFREPKHACILTYRKLPLTFEKNPGSHSFLIHEVPLPEVGANVSRWLRSVADEVPLSRPTIGRSVAGDRAASVLIGRATSFWMVAAPSGSGTGVMAAVYASGEQAGNGDSRFSTSPSSTNSATGATMVPTWGVVRPHP